MASQTILLDLGRCVSCEACVVACKTGNELPTGQTYINIREDVRGTFPNLWGTPFHKRCFHCADAPCVSVCPTGALSKVDGLTAVDQGKCTACAYCAEVCPYGIPSIVDGAVSKCHGCTELAQTGQEPWCVQTCPSQALKIGPREEMLALAKQRLGEMQRHSPKAEVYGETQLGGLGLLMILPDAPSAFGLPVNPEPSQLTQAWQQAVQPATVGLTGLSVIGTALAFIIARREHRKEKAALRAAAAAAQTTEGR